MEEVNLSQKLLVDEKALKKYLQILFSSINFSNDPIPCKPGGLHFGLCEYLRRDHVRELLDDLCREPDNDRSTEDRT